MPTLTDPELESLLAPYAATTPELRGQLGIYLDLLVKWNVRTNLTAIRDPREMVQRHFGESLFAAAILPPAATLLDFGSGGGFPGLPMQLAHPGLRVVLAESQNKKVAFLREVVRSLGVRTEVWSGRVDTMPSTRLFDVVALRAVDRPEEAAAEAWQRVALGGSMLEFVSEATENSISLPGRSKSFLKLTAKI